MQSFFSSLARNPSLFCFLRFSPCCLREPENPRIGRPLGFFLLFFSFFFFFGKSSLGLVFSLELGDLFLSQNLGEFSMSFSRMDFGLCINHLLVMVISHCLHDSQQIIFSTRPCLVIYSLCVNLLHSLIMKLNFLSFSLQNLHVRFCCVLYTWCHQNVSRHFLYRHLKLS